MRSLTHYGVAGLTCVEVRPAGHAYVRWFRYPYPLVQVLRPDGQPDCDWDWFACLEMHAGNVLWAFGAKGMPTMREFRDILVAATLLGARWLQFEHRGRIHSFSLNNYLRDALTPPTQGVRALTPMSLQNIMDKPTNQALVILGTVTIGPGGAIENVTGATVIGGLSGVELAETVKDLVGAVANNDHATGEPLPE